jgi:hypothetical protein
MALKLLSIDPTTIASGQRLPNDGPAERRAWNTPRVTGIAQMAAIALSWNRSALWHRVVEEAGFRDRCTTNPLKEHP